MSDQLEAFRALLPTAGNQVENIPNRDEYENVAASHLGGGGGQSVGPPFGGGGGDMDGWQISVEKRLDSLDRRTTAIEADTGQIKVDTAVLRRDVDELPKKGFIIKTVTGGAAFVSAIVVLVEVVRRLIS